MGTGFIALAVAAALLLYAIFNWREIGVMVSVLAYAAVVGWIIHYALAMLMAALAVAIILGMVALVTVVGREMSSQIDTVRHTRHKSSANNRPVVQNIGS